MHCFVLGASLTTRVIHMLHSHSTGSHAGLVVEAAPWYE